MSEAEALFGVLRQSVRSEIVDALERLVTQAPDRKVCRLGLFEHLATERKIFATGVVLDDPRASSLLAARGITPQSHDATLRGIASAISIYTIP